MSPIVFFVGLCAGSAASCFALGRFFPECLLQAAIRWILYIAGVILLLVGVYVGVLAHLAGAD